jgi:hypothetical protein
MANYETLPGAIAGEDFSTKQFTFVGLSASATVDFEVISSTANTVHPVGILQNNPDTSGHPAEVAISGVCKLAFGGTIAQGGLIAVGAAGRGAAYSTGAGEWIVAESLQNGTATGVYYVKLLTPSRHST